MQHKKFFRARKVIPYGNRLDTNKFKTPVRSAAMAGYFASCAGASISPLGRELPAQDGAGSSPPVLFRLRLRDARVAKMQPQPRCAASIAAMSIFFICIIASNAGLAAARSGSVTALVRATGVICHDKPHLSLHQPHALSTPPLPTIAFQ